MLGIETTWRVSHRGYEWHSEPGTRKLPPDHWLAGSDRFLTDGLPAQESWTVARVYDPYREQPTLFQDFARLEPTEEQFQRFADRFGLLFNPQSLRQIRNRRGKVAVWAVSYREWSQAHGRMRKALLLAEALRDKDRRKLESLRQEIDESYRRARDHVHQYGRDWAAATLSIEPPPPALSFRGRSLFAFEWGARDSLDGELSPTLQWPECADRPRLLYRPSGLLGIMWLQFAEWLTTPKTFTACPMCAQRFEISQEETGHRRTRKFCSNKCRQRAYRQGLSQKRR